MHGQQPPVREVTTGSPWWRRSPIVKSVLDPPFSSVEDAPSEHSRVEGRLAKLEWENKIFLGQVVVTKHTEACEAYLQVRADHAGNLRVDTRTPPKRGGPKFTVSTPEVELPPPLEVIMHAKPVAMPPPAAQLLAQHSAQPQAAGQSHGHANLPTGLPPTPATLMVGEHISDSMTCARAHGAA